MRSPISKLTVGLLAIASAPFVAIKAAVARRRIVGHLAGFDDHLLRDIGLTRGDVDSVVGGYSWRDDPTLRLALMVQDARTGRRAAAREQMQWARMASEAELYGASDKDRRAA